MPPSEAAARAFAVRRAVPVRWTKVLRLGTAQANDRTYYLEGEVSYTPDARSAAGHVWLQVRGEREATDAEVVLTDADRQNRSGACRSASFRLAAPAILGVRERSSGSTSRYEIFELRREPRAGACSK